MRGKLLFAAGLAAGYVVGARAGRPAYDAIVRRMTGIAESPEAHAVAAKAKDALEDRAPAVAAVAEQVASTAAGAASAASDVAVDDGGPDGSGADAAGTGGSASDGTRTAADDRGAAATTAS